MEDKRVIKESISEEFYDLFFNTVKDGVLQQKKNGLKIGEFKIELLKRMRKIGYIKELK